MNKIIPAVRAQNWVKILSGVLFLWGLFLISIPYVWFVKLIESDNFVEVVFGYCASAMTSATLVAWAVYEGKQIDRLRSAEEIERSFYGHTNQTTYWMEQSQMALSLLEAEQRKNKTLTERLSSISNPDKSNNQDT